MTLAWGREVCGRLGIAESREWLCTNGIGGFASCTVAGVLTRRYHGLLVAALTPPLGRTLLVSKLDETLEYDTARQPLFSNRWGDGNIDPLGITGTPVIAPVLARNPGGVRNGAPFKNWLWSAPGAHAT